MNHEKYEEIVKLHFGYELRQILYAIYKNKLYFNLDYQPDETQD